MLICAPKTVIYVLIYILKKNDFFAHKILKSSKQIRLATNDYFEEAIFINFLY